MDPRKLICLSKMSFASRAGGTCPERSHGLKTQRPIALRSKSSPPMDRRAAPNWDFSSAPLRRFVRLAVMVCLVLVRRGLNDLPAFTAVIQPVSCDLLGTSCIFLSRGADSKVFVWFFNCVCGARFLALFRSKLGFLQQWSAVLRSGGMNGAEQQAVPRGARLAAEQLDSLRKTRQGGHRRSFFPSSCLQSSVVRIISDWSPGVATGQLRGPTSKACGAGIPLWCSWYS